MGYTWRTHGDGTVDPVECHLFAEVAYEDDDSLAARRAVQTAGT